MNIIIHYKLAWRGILERLMNSIFMKYMKQVICRYKDDDVSAMSAQIAYYLILSFFPFLLFLINLLSFTHITKELLIADFSKFLPAEASVLLKNVLIQTIQAKSKSLLVVSVIGSLWAASKGIKSIMKGLNKAYDAEEDRNFIRLNAISITTTIAITVMIIISFTLIVLGKILGTYLFGLFGAKALFGIIWTILRYCIALAIIFSAFSLIYKFVPNRNIKFRSIKVGTIFTTIGWVTTSYLFSFYVNNFANYEKIYGSLGGIIALMIWLYISAVIILLGGELNATSSYFQNNEKNEKYESFELKIPLISKYLNK